VRTFEKGGGAKKGFWFFIFFPNILRNYYKISFGFGFFSPPPPTF
jgi:hypothetical protein